MTQTTDLDVISDVRKRIDDAYSELDDADYGISRARYALEKATDLLESIEDVTQALDTREMDTMLSALGYFTGTTEEKIYRVIKDLYDKL